MNNSTNTLIMIQKGMFFSNDLLDMSKLYVDDTNIVRFFDGSDTSDLGVYYDVLNYVDTLRDKPDYLSPEVLNLRSVVLTNMLANINENG
jgi:hypothetical protein